MDMYHRILLFCSSGEWTEWSYLHDTISLVWRAIWWSSDVEFVEYPQFVRIDTNALFFHEIQLHETQQTSLDIDWPIRIVCFRLQINQLSRNHSVKTKKFYLKDLNCKVLPLVCLYEVGPFFIILGLVQLQSEKDPGLPSELHHRVKLSNYCATFIFTITLLAGHLSPKSETLRHVSHQGTTHSVLGWLSVSTVKHFCIRLDRKGDVVLCS